MTTAPTRRTNRPRVVYITNSPPTTTTEERTTRGGLRARTTEVPRTTTEEDDRPATEFTDGKVKFYPTLDSSVKNNSDGMTGFVRNRLLSKF